MSDILAKIPDWVGTAPQWGMFILLVIAFIRVSPEWLRILVEDQRAKRNRLGGRISELEAEIKRCHNECDQRIRAVQNELWGQRRQNIQAQISLVNTIIQTVDAPELKKFLAVLENVQATLQVERGADVLHTQVEDVIQKEQGNAERP